MPKPTRSVGLADVLNIHGAINYLAQQCDGARSLDGCGFNKMDSGEGHELAAMDPLSFDNSDIITCARMVIRYRRQLRDDRDDAVRAARKALNVL